MIALLLVIAALVAVAILGTVLLTRDDTPKASQEDRVRTTIQNFDTAIQKGDLATLRSITCGETADSYIKYDDARWKDIHARVAAARQYPVVASIDQVAGSGAFWALKLYPITSSALNSTPMFGVAPDVPKASCTFGLPTVAQSP